ncbi:MAG TPA: YibE/F family protein [Baekduia sp.]|uniref:YibE/F family protein n=1 Tax=Baekduia sp. TaxID=2600305 RepID=UPI002D795EC7|nr:YibE/F family protein [Baekduia sp.]HET6508078.1 YibE/F family protein [Baekduia sp.]
MATDDAYDELLAEYDRRARERRERRDARQRRRGPRRARRRRRPIPVGRELRALAATRGGRVLVGAVGTVAALTLIGLLALWPYGWHPHGEGVGATLPAHVERVVDGRCPSSPVPQDCRTLTVRTEGRTTTIPLGPVTAAAAVRAGESVRVSKVAGTYSFVDVDRHGGLLWIGAVLVLLALALLRWRGLLALGGVALSLFIVLAFLVPAILDGRPALLVALVASLAVMFVTLVLTNGLGAQTLAAALGISVTLALACGLAEAAVTLAHLDGKTDDVTLALGAQNGTVSLTGVVLAAMLVGALGVLADTAVTQASAVMALRRANPTLGVARLYREAFVVGRDHLSATIHTLVLAYTGAALPLLLIMRQSRLPLSDALNAQSIAEPIAATAVGCVALIAAVPLTTGLAAALVARIPAASVPDGHGHGHSHGH